MRLSDEEVAGDRGGFDDALDANADGLRQNSASSVGGSANNVSANRKGVISNQKWYTEPMAKAEGNITRVPDDVFATIGVKAAKFVDERNDALMLTLMDELRRRMAGNMAGIAAEVHKAEKKEERNEKSTTSKPSGAVAEDAGVDSEAESDGETEAGAEPKYDAKTVIQEEKSDRLNAKEAREQAAAAEAVNARNKSVTITVNGVDREIGDAPSALAFVNKKLADANLTEAKLDIKLVKVANPDMGKETTIPSGITFKDGTEAANWLSKNADKPFVRLVAAKIAKALSGVNVVLVTDTSTLHPEIQEHFAKNARGLFVVDFNTVYVSDKYNTEEVWVHELLHAAITSKLADPATRAEVSVLAKRVSQSLDTTPSGSWPINDRDTLLLHKFFQSNAIFGDPDEFMAYALTSPSFQTLLSQLSADGRWLKPGAQGKLVAVPELSLMKKIVAFVLKLFGFEPKYTREVTNALWKNKLTQENNQRLLTEAQAKGKLEDTLHGLLSRLIVESADSTAQGRVSSGNTKGTNNTGKLDVKPNVGFSKMAPANAQSAPAATVEKTIQSLPVGLRPVARAVNAVLGGYARRALNTINFTEDLLKRASALGITAADKYRQIANQRSSFVGAHERRVQAVTDMYDALPAVLKGKGPGTVNGFLYDSTQDEKWGYQPDYLTEKVDIDPAMKARFDAMPEGQAFIKAAFAHGATVSNNDAKRI